MNFCKKCGCETENLMCNDCSKLCKHKKCKQKILSNDMCFRHANKLNKEANFEDKKNNPDKYCCHKNCYFFNKKEKKCLYHHKQHEISKIKRREYEKRPDRIKRRKERCEKYKKEGKYIEWTNRSRLKKINEIGIDEYRKQNAEYQKNYMKNNKKVRLNSYKNRKLSINDYFTYYMRRAKEKGYEWKLTRKFVENIVHKSSCYYCNQRQKNKLMGIDRIDNKKGYILINVVPCCSMCNYMKKDYSMNKFLKKCREIANNYNKVKSIFI